MARCFAAAVGFVVVLALSWLGAVTPASAATLTNAGASPSTPLAGTSGVTYSFAFTLASSASFNKLTMTLPSGTGGTPSGVTVTGMSQAVGGYALSITPGTAALTGTTLTIPVNKAWRPAGGVISVSVGGLTNTATTGDYASTISTMENAATVDTGVSGSYSIVAAALTSPAWSASSTVVSATGTSYTVSFSTATTAMLASVTLAAPSGTAGTPTLGAVSGLPTGGSISGSGSTFTYAFSATSIAAGTRVTLTIGGLTNVSVSGSDTSLVTTRTASAPVDAVMTNALVFTSGALGSPGWSADLSAVGATGATYTYTFTIGTSAWADRISMSLPPGAAGTPTLQQLSAAGPYTNPLSGGSVAIAAGVLTVSFTAAYLNAGWVVTVVVGGLTNPPYAGSYTASIATSSVANSAFVDSGTTGAQIFTSMAMTGISWSPASSVVGASGVAYQYTFGLSATATIDAVTMTLPAGTAGTPTVGSITPAALAGGTVAVSGTTLTYTLPSSQSVSDSSTVQMTFGGFTNTPTAGSYAAALTVRLGGSTVASGTSPGVAFTATALTGLSWASSSQSTSTAATYTFGLTTPAVGMTLSSITFTVPTGTTGTPALGTISAYDQYGTVSLAGTSIARSGTTLTLSFTAQYFQPGTVLSIGVTGLTNTPTAGSYASTITVFNSANPQASATTSSLAFSSVSVGTASWTSSAAAVGATGVSYTFGFTLSATATVSSVTMTVPSGTAGTAALGTVTPVGMSGGTLTTSGNTLTYAFSQRSITGDAPVSITITGLTNTATAGTYTSNLTLYNDSATIIASGTTTSVTLTASALTAVSWTLGSATTWQAGVSYTWQFTTASTNNQLNQITMTLPAGTAGTPAIGSIATSPAVALSGTSVSLAGTTLTLAFNGTTINSGVAFTIQVTGLTNTPSPGAYSSSVVTRSSGTARDSGVTGTVSITSPPPVVLTWTLSNQVAGTQVVTQTFAFTTSTTTTIDSIVVALPAGTGGTPTIDALSPAALATGATVSLSGSTLTVGFPATSIAASTAVSLQIGGLTNPAAAGSYTAQAQTRSGAWTVDTAISAATTIAARSLTAATTCAATTACQALAGGGTQLTFLLIPGLATPVSAGVSLQVATNAPYGYVVSVQSTALTSGTNVLSEAATGGAASVTADRFGATAALTPAVGSGAAFCGAYAGSAAQIGYATTATSLWQAAASTGAGSDTVVVTNLLRVSATQPAGIYTGAISYAVTPRYSSGSGC